MASEMDYEGIRKRLVREREGLARDIEHLEEIAERIRSDRGDDRGRVSNHMAEEASNTFDQERNLALLSNLQRTLASIDAALSRLDSATYGQCEICGKTIDRARLQALPYAARCVECQTRLEES
jgi:RNA polymerase-binding transcription factor DksA